MSSRAASSLAAVLVFGGCAPLPPRPELQGPNGERAAASPPATREVVWIRSAGTLRIQHSSVCQRGAKASDSCTRISSADREQLERFFGSTTFRARWDAYEPCAVRTSESGQAFVVTFADGHHVGKPLDRNFDAALTRPCDRTTHDTLVGIGDDLVRRYFRDR